MEYMSMKVRVYLQDDEMVEKPRGHMKIESENGILQDDKNQIRLLREHS